MPRQNYQKLVKEQYEQFPYPPRNPEDEKKRLAAPMSESLDLMNYYCFSGKKDFSKGFRTLVAGGGTGDSVVYLAEQLRDTDAEIFYMDISKASMEVAQERAKVRGLNNIIWIESSLLEIPRLNLGEFDYINCSGVLHHLESPEDGLAAVASVLKDDGAMGLMVYAKYGRASVYQIQDLMRLINQSEKSQQAKVDNCWPTLESLEPKHWHKAFYPDCADKRRYLDTDIYDLYLHSQDRPYTVLDLYDLLETQALKILQFLPLVEKQGLKLYQPETYIKDEALLTTVKSFDTKHQQAIAELLHGHITKHTLFAAKHHSKRPTIKNLDSVPFLSCFCPPIMYEKIYQVACRCKEIVRIGFPELGRVVGFNKTQNTESLLKHLNGERTAGEIFDLVKIDNPQTTNESLSEEFAVIFGAFANFYCMLLRDKSVPRFLKLDEMQQRLSDANNHRQ